MLISIYYLFHLYIYNFTFLRRLFYENKTTSYGPKIKIIKYISIEKVKWCGGNWGKSTKMIH